MPKIVHALIAIALTGCAHIDEDIADVPEMIRIEPGQFRAGSDVAETDSARYPANFASREQPARIVMVERAFAIGRTEVTRGQFARFVSATGWRADGPCSFLADAPNNVWQSDDLHDWSNPGFPQTDRHPVICVNLADAQAYAAWLSKTTGRKFRLPSNTEWEYAARAGTRAARFWEDDSGEDACRYANVSDRQFARLQNRAVFDASLGFDCDDGYSHTAPVASFRANAWGLYDVIGNVWEWTADCLNDSQHSAPSDTRARQSGDCGSHINRGASWVNSPKYVRLAAQHPDLVGARTTVLGFRLVEDLPARRIIRSEGGAPKTTKMGTQIMGKLCCLACKLPPSICG